MSEPSDQAEPAAPQKRGEAAYKAQKESIAARNDKTRRADRLSREARESQEAQKRRAGELRERGSLGDIAKQRH